MKKLFIIMTLFMSSFFLFCSKEVRAADVYEVNYSDTSLELIDDYFFEVRNIVIDFANTNSYNYFIRYTSSSYYIVYFFDSNITSLTSIGRVWFEFKDVSMYVYEIDKNLNLTYTSNSSSFVMSSDYLYQLLDTNLNIYYNPYSIQINYLNLSYLVDSTNTVPSLFDIYCDYYDYVEENPHQEEIDKVTNFYNTVIEKLGYLAETIVSNYIYLSIIVIFILIFIFQLIFRRFL